MRFTYQAGAQPLAGYTIQRGIHRGGFGEVYFANSAGGKEVALKLLHREDQDVEIRGVTQCLNLKHPNLVNLFDLKTDDQGDHWVVMEYVGGSNLEDVLTSFPDGLPLTEIRDWLTGLVAGVAHLHERGIVHRDLKPANVYCENGIVKVGDVGLSKRLESDRRRQHTQSVGTVYYMAPEVARGQYGPEVDVYSLGVMLHEMITGKLPFDGETTAEILMKHLTAQPDLSVIPPQFRPTLARALEKDPAKRTSGVQQLERDFMSAFTSSATDSGPTTIPESSFLPPLPANAGNSNRSRNGFHPSSTNSSGVKLSPATVHGTSRFSNSFLFFVSIAVWCIAIPSVGFAARHHFVGPIWPRMMLFASPIGIYFLYKTLQARFRQSEVSATLPHVHAKFNAHRSLADAVNSNGRAVKPLHEIIRELSRSVGFAGVAASFISVGLYWVLKESFPRLMPTTEITVFFTTVAIIGSWLMLLSNSIATNSSFFRHRQWLLRVGTGAAIGLCAFELHRFLNIDYPKVAFSAASIVRKIGNRPLDEINHNPTQLGYIVFFAVLLGIRNWSRTADAFRKKRFRVWSTIFAVALGFISAVIFQFPQWYAMLWAGTIAATVQLSSTWTPTPVLAKGR